MADLVSLSASYEHFLKKGLAGFQISMTNRIDEAILTGLKVGDYPEGIVMHPTNNRLYVSNGVSSTLTVIDTTNNSLHTTIPVLNRPRGLALSLDGEFLYVANGGADRVSVMNTSTNTVEHTIPVGDMPNVIAITPETGEYAYVSNAYSGNVSVIRTSDNSVEKTIPVGVNPAGIAIDPFSGYVYVANHEHNSDQTSVSIINPSSLAVDKTIPITDCFPYGPWDLELSRDGKYVFVSISCAGTIRVIDTATQEMLDSVINVGDWPMGISLTPNGQYLYVANSSSDTVSIIDLCSQVLLPEFQSIPTHGAGDIEQFTMSGELCLAVSNSNNDSTNAVDSDIYKWDGSSFGKIQSIPTTGAEAWESFEINGRTYLAVTSEDLDGFSYVYKWDDGTGSFIWVQDIPTNNALDFESFEIDGDVYLAVANYRDAQSKLIDSVIYKWDSTLSEFEEFQRIPSTGGKSWEYFTINDTPYLALANYHDGSSYRCDSKIFRWDGSQFLQIQVIETWGASDWEFFRIDGETYLALVNCRHDDTSYAINSIIFKWEDGQSQFVETQSIATKGAQDWEHFSVNGSHYLAVANSYDGTTFDVDSALYLWDEEESSFVEILTVPTHEAFDWESFSINGQTYLAVANRRNASTHNIDSKIYRVEISCPESTYCPGPSDPGYLEPWEYTASLNTGGSHRCAAVDNGYIYAVGGFNHGHLINVEYTKIDPATGNLINPIDNIPGEPQLPGAWEDTSFLNIQRYGHAVTAHNGYIYAVGGHDGSSILSSVEYAKTDENYGSLGLWNFTLDMPKENSSPGVAVYNGYLYVVGGHRTINGQYAYYDTIDYAEIQSDGSLGAWNTSLNTLNTRRYAFGICVYNNYIYAVGGATEGGIALDSVEYAEIGSDGEIGTWNYTTPLALHMYGNSAVVSDGYLYSVGGVIPDPSDPYAYPVWTNAVRMAKFNTNGTLGTWCDTSPLQEARSSSGVVEHNGYMYFVGGWGGMTDYKSTVEYTKIITSEPVITVRLEDSTGQAIDGGVVHYADGSWKEFGTTGDSAPGETEMQFPEDTTSVTVRMTYGGVSEIRTVSISGSTTIVFSTVNACVRLESSIGDPLEGGTVHYAAGSWREFGTTGTDGFAYKELLPGSYTIRMSYLGKTQSIAQDIGSCVVFQTVNACVRLKSSIGDPLEGGTVHYAAGSWREFGTTGTDGFAYKELMPGSYKIRMAYLGKTKSITQDIGSCVVFQTVNACVRLKSSIGDPLEGGTVHYAAGSWREFGTTGSDGFAYRELLPGSYTIRMSYLGKTQSITRDIGSCVVFQTVNACVRLKSCIGGPLEGGVVHYAAGSWREFGTTGSDGFAYRELLPGSYTIRLNHLGITESITQDIGSRFVFQTGQVFGSSCDAYAAGWWRPFTDGMELLPSQCITFRCDGGNITCQPVEGTAINLDTDCPNCP